MSSRKVMIFFLGFLAFYYCWDWSKSLLQISISYREMQKWNCKNNFLISPILPTHKLIVYLFQLESKWSYIITGLYLLSLFQSALFSSTFSLSNLLIKESSVICAVELVTALILMLMSSFPFLIHLVLI